MGVGLMKNLLVGNGINIQFGGYENTNEAIIVRGIKDLEKEVKRLTRIIFYERK